MKLEAEKRVAEEKRVKQEAEKKAKVEAERRIRKALEENGHIAAYVAGLDMSSKADQETALLAHFTSYKPSSVSLTPQRG